MRDYEFPATVLDGPTDQRVPLQDEHSLADALHRLQRAPRIALRAELEYPFEMVERTCAQPDVRDAFSRGRRFVSPLARASR